MFSQYSAQPVGQRLLPMTKFMLLSCLIAIQLNISWISVQSMSSHLFPWTLLVVSLQCGLQTGFQYDALKVQWKLCNKIYWYTLTCNLFKTRYYERDIILVQISLLWPIPVGILSSQGNTTKYRQLWWQLFVSPS